MLKFKIKHENKIKYYVDLYKYLYFDAPMPDGVNTYGYLMYIDHYDQLKNQKSTSKKAIHELV